MSEHELQRVEVLSRVLDGTMRTATAASVLAITARQAQRLLVCYRDEGAGAIRHRLRGRLSNNRIGVEVRNYALWLRRKTYAEFGPTSASEKLAERHGVQVSTETLRKWMISDGLSRALHKGAPSILHPSGGSISASWCRSTAAYRWLGCGVRRALFWCPMKML